MKKIKKHRIYCAGPLFTRGDIATRKADAAAIRKILGKSVKLYSPIEYNEKCWAEDMTIEELKRKVFEKEIK
ncbi:MAG: hypothetical protein HUJ52_03220, partial [Malacoplasma sp.]|nr:hypothetical protein [Malacoplasma sp.]